MTDPEPSRQATPATWFTERVTVTLPRWVLVGVGAAAVILLLVALD
jgi:hypothetical protein